MANFDFPIRIHSASWKHGNNFLRRNFILKSKRFLILALNCASIDVLFVIFHPLFKINNFPDLQKVGKSCISSKQLKIF
jgi:hypothetical protein